MTTERKKELKEKILKGIELSFKKLLLLKQTQDGELIISKDGKVVKMNAKDFKA